jgi:hypothetical protein
LSKYIYPVYKILKKYFIDIIVILFGYKIINIYSTSIYDAFTNWNLEIFKSMLFEFKDNYTIFFMHLFYIVIAGIYYITVFICRKYNSKKMKKEKQKHIEIGFRREAARLYYDNEKSIQIILDATTDSLMKTVINDILSQELLANGKAKYTAEKIDSILQTSGFETKIKEKMIRESVIAKLKNNDLIKSELSSIFAKIQLDKEKVIEKFIRDGEKAPHPPIYWIGKRYFNYISYENPVGKKVNSYIQEKITQTNIDNYIIEQKKNYKK